jgi:LEA14-like dessication related protein
MMEPGLAVCPGVALAARMHLKRLLPALLAATCLLFAGCNTRDARVGEIGVTILEVRPGAADLTEIGLTLRFINENIMPFGFSRSTHRVQFNGTPVGRIMNESPFGLAPTSTITREVTLQVENPALLRQWLAEGGDRTVSYRIESELQSQRGEERLRVRNIANGRLDLSPLAAAR